MAKDLPQLVLLCPHTPCSHHAKPILTGCWLGSEQSMFALKAKKSCSIYWSHGSNSAVQLARVFAVKEGPNLLYGGGADRSTSSIFFHRKCPPKKKSQSMNILNIQQEIFHKWQKGELISQKTDHCWSENLSWSLMGVTAWMLQAAPLLHGLRHMGGPHPSGCKVVWAPRLIREAAQSNMIRYECAWIHFWRLQGHQNAVMSKERQVGHRQWWCYIHRFAFTWKSSAFAGT